MKLQECKVLMSGRKLIPALAVNSMIVGYRDFEEAFELAEYAEKTMGINTLVDLRSRRNITTDKNGLWAGAHENSSFDVISGECIESAVSLAEKYHKNIIAVSVYLGVINKQDFEYGIKVINEVIKLTHVAPLNNIIIRIVGGSKKSLINDECKKVFLSNLRKLLHHACNVEKSYYQQSGLKSRITFGLEIHQGQYPQNIGDVIEIYHNLMNCPEEVKDHIGIIEDPANRYISTFGAYLNPTLAARIIHSAGGNIIYYHLKDVQFIDKWDGKKNRNWWMEGFQQVGKGTLFDFENKIFEWKKPGEGDINFQDCVDAAMKYSNPPHDIIAFSTEHIPASINKKEAQEIIKKYCTIIRRALIRNQNMIGVRVR